MASTMLSPTGGSGGRSWLSGEIQSEHNEKPLTIKHPFDMHFHL